MQTKKSRLIAETFWMDPAGLAPASLGANANLLLHTTRARVRNYYTIDSKTKEATRRRLLLQHLTLARDVTKLASTIIITDKKTMSRGGKIAEKNRTENRGRAHFLIQNAK